MKVQNALLIIAAAVGLVFGQYNLGTLTQYGQEYKSIIDTITSFYNQQQREYNKINKGLYLWKFMDISQYPYWCSDTSLNNSGLSICLDDKGTTVLWSRRNSCDRIQIVAMNWTTSRAFPEKRYFRMFFFRKIYERWIMEREPLKTVVRVNKEPFYYYCE